MDKIIVFGIGCNFRKYRLQIESHYEVISLVDNNWEKLQNNGDNVVSVDTIKDKIYDFILITPNECKDMIEQIHSIGVPDEKIKIMKYMDEFFKLDILGYSYWGQHCDDLLLASIFAMIGIEKPSYIDLGANHPILFSNTYFLYNQGCRGINIEANPNMMAAFEAVRPEDINLNIGISVREGKMPFYVFGEQSGLNTFSKQEAGKWDIPIKNVIELPVARLEDVVKKYCPNGFPDFLDCDIEGLDFDVLNDYDFISDGPKVICVEVRKEDIDKFDAMLKSKGYFRFCRLGENNIYVKKEYSDILSHISI